MKNDNSTSVLVTLFRKLKIPVTAASISEEFEKHPDYPSFAAISDVLDYWDVPNGALQLEIEELEQVPTPYIVSLSSNGGEFAVLHKIDSENVYLSNEHFRNHRMLMSEFRKVFGGSVLIAEKSSTSGEEGYREKQKIESIEKYRGVFIALATIGILLNLIFQAADISRLNAIILILTFLKTVGLGTSILLLIHSIDANNPVVIKLCNSANAKCDDILSSEAAKLTPYLSWSEVGFFYFGGTWLLLLTNTDGRSVLTVLAFMSLLCLPYSLYSISYQFYNRKWCVFCLTIQAVFWLEFITFIPYLDVDALDLSGVDIANLVSGLAVPVVLWAFLKPILTKAAKLTPIKAQLRKFKYNPSLFKKVLYERPQYTLLEEEHTIMLGNKDAKNVITIVSNPTCIPCAKAHKDIELLLKEKEDLRIQIVFKYTDEETMSQKVAKHLYQLKFTNDDKIHEAVNYWYEKANRGFKAWSALYPVGEVLADCESLDLQKSWVKTTGVKQTPTIFLNGYKFPQIWQIQDIKYLV